MKRGKILVIRGGAIGDFVLTLPVLTALRRRFPQTQLEVLGYPHIASLTFAGGLVDAVHSIEARSLAGFFARHGQLDASLADYFANFAIILSYLYDPDGIFQENVARCSTAQFIAGPHRPDEKLSRHATETFLKPLERLAIFDNEATPRLELADMDSALPANGRWLALHPGSGSEQKNWPEKNWSLLVAHLLAATDLNLLLVGGEAEGARLERLAGMAAFRRIQLARSLPLTELARRFHRCAGFIGHDSGITHLAAAVGLPCLALWGASNATVWRPLGEHVTILRAPDGLEKLPVERVLIELADFLSQRVREGVIHARKFD
ncbi:MAG: glycosyltransferase family 9 protein [Verrucomicrobia bacterium]|nr:glycosyltransferase family 9 protein [Verrucomicrobiota bacterium]